ncbi:MAG: ribosome maturation factor RimP [Clostridia bacterium]|nr:ribosome maturation factor RimP [Clostridia bacterium]
MAKNVAKTVEELIKSTVEGLGITLWNVELEKEGSGLNLLVTIDKDEGITINDCSEVTRAIDPMLDEADPIPTSYCLEVSSVGAERVLKRSEHYDYAVRTALPVTVKLFAAYEGAKEHVLVMKGWDENGYTFEKGNGEVRFEKKAVARLCIFHEIQ